ncbi:Protein CBG27583 [Caenorhabditis briggsae]|uniref:Uncharacterized protein n=2 Tax=Caenorhabditis briggsae TaxID=6238 RepID=A0AAE8ZPJ3_CAEBR|nr:Protein CBG27583 [Caenorhabditis briggsae]ULT81283.1 hypothetical protein L3Y34_011277 [Caenorhabditis briggsae]CAS00383.1 Protein CBG27583 [Caenorhabditis briggsae]
MVDLKAIASPKVAVPIAGIVILIAVSTLVAIFYIRNPTVTDSLFGTGGNSTEPGDSSTNDHVTQSEMGSSAHLLQTTTPGNHEEKSTTPSSTTTVGPVTLPMTPSFSQSSTPMHAIEPVQHL